MTLSIDRDPPDDLPEELAGLVAGYSWRSISVGCSPAHVYHLTRRDAPGLYLKISRRDMHDPVHRLEAECARLRWMRGRLPVPDVHACTGNKVFDYLLTSEVVGQAAHAVEREEAGRTIGLLARGLRMIHALPIDDCPFDHRIDRELAAARERMERGFVDESEFDQGLLGTSARTLYERLLETKPANEDLVVTHGDYSLPNIVLDGETIGGFIDVGHAGVGDRYRDLALAAWSVAFNLGEEWVLPLFREYGIDEPDPVKLAFFTTLDEFF
jgi:aminoglycoside phosphotransferase